MEVNSKKKLSIIVSYDNNFVGAEIVIKCQVLVLNIKVILCLSIAHVMNLGWVFYCIPVLFLAG
jgi:hypothetical protein